MSVQQEHYPPPGRDVSLDEIADCIAIAASSSAHARRAYQLMFEKWPQLRPLKARQGLIAGRMDEVATCN